LKVKVGTRESKLAVAQSKIIIEQIWGKYSNIEFELIPIKTSGDAMLDQRLEKIGGKGLFVKEIEYALLNKRIDIAIHSMKDMPAEMTSGLKIAAVSVREDPRDVLVCKRGLRFNDLPEGSVIGTSSLRREIQLKNLRTGIRFKLLRGNVNSRIEKMNKGEYDAIVVAAAGLKRLGMENLAAEYFEVCDIIPAVGQGILGVQTREDFDSDFIADAVHCNEAELQLKAERAYMVKLGGGCSIPIGAHAVIIGDDMLLYGMYADTGKNILYKDCIRGQKEDAQKLGQFLAEKILKQVETQANK